MRMKCEGCGEYGRRKHRLVNGNWDLPCGISIELKPVIPPFYCASCRSKGPPAELKCTGKNVKGGNCKHWRIYDSKYCTQHKYQGESK